MRQMRSLRILLNPFGQRHDRNLALSCRSILPAATPPARPTRLTSLFPDHRRSRTLRTDLPSGGTRGRRSWLDFCHRLGCVVINSSHVYQVLLDFVAEQRHQAVHVFAFDPGPAVRVRDLDEFLRKEREVAAAPEDRCDKTGNRSGPLGVDGRLRVDEDLEWGALEDVEG